MEYRRLGSSGLKVSALSFGSWVTFGPQVDVKRAMEMVTTAYDAGVNFFDNAEVYARGESERIMGEAFSRLALPRDAYCLSSKVFMGCVENPKPTQQGLCRKHVMDGCHQALKRLKTNYLDLYFCHRPDPETPVEETVRAMDVLVRQGKVLYWGTSEWPAEAIREAHEVARREHLTPPTMEQPQYNLFARKRVEEEYAPLYAEFGLGTTIWSPLASGLLTGKYNKGIPEDSRLALPGYEWLRGMVESEEGRAKLASIQELASIADELGISLARLSLGWCLKNDKVSTVILGASRKSQLEENLTALEVVPLLTDEVMRRITEVSKKVSDI